ncbi:FHA domain-containing protein [Corallococcus terminator]|uniref:FHA domain-containing protein n=1 Tax=Corallococcus terminator TaxID=2316733 RepID=UPI003558C0E1
MTQGLQVGRELAFEQAEVKIGRTSENDLVLHDHGVSRRHARITAKDGQYFAEDVGSANGTQLNGQPLGGQKQLRDGDRITVGPVEFTFVWMPQDDEADVTRPIRRVLAPAHAQVSPPQGLEQASLAEIEAAPTSYQQSLPVMARPSFLPTPVRSGAAAKSLATPAAPLAPPPTKKPEAVVPPPKRPSAPDLPAVGAPAQGRASGPRLPALGAPTLNRAARPAGEASSQGRASGPGLPAGGASTPNRAAPAGEGTPAQGRASGPGLAAVGAPTSNRAAPAVQGAPAQGRASEPGLPVAGASAKGGPSAPGPSAASGKFSAPGPVSPDASSAPKRVAPPGPPVLDAAAPKKAPPGLPSVGAPALNRPSLGRGAARGAEAAKPPSLQADAPAAPPPPGPSAPRRDAPSVAPVASGRPTASPPVNRGAVASVPLLPPVPALTPPVAPAPVRGSPAPASGLPVLSPSGVVPPPVTAPVASWDAPPASLFPVDPDEPEERTLMAIPVVESPGPALAAPPVAPPALSFVDPDEPEEHTLMAISTVDSPEPLFSSPPVAAPALAFVDPEEPEEHTLMAISAVDSPEPQTQAAPSFAPPEAAALPSVAEEEPEEHTVLDLRPIVPVSPLVPRPVLHGAPPPKAAAPVFSAEPPTYVGQDQDIPAAPPDDALSDVQTFIGKDGPGAPPVLAPSPARSAPVAPPPPFDPAFDPVTFVGKDRPAAAAPPASLAASPPAAGAGLLALLSSDEGDATQPLPPSDPDASSSQPARSVTVVAKVEPSSAADKARRRRQLARSLGGQFVLFWSRQSLLRRVGYASLAGVVVLAALFGVVTAVTSQSLRLPGREPFKLGLEPVPDSFGFGQGVRWSHVDDKVFDFRFVSPTRAVAVLHYQASSISKDEVNLSLNGVSLGWVPPDTAQTQERELEQVMPPGLLRRNENNQLLFDNALNPPGQESWRIWNLRLEIIPVPELPPAQLLASAREAATAGARFYELKDVGGENLFRAWQQYRAAWITLEALDEKPELYEDVRERIARISTELDHRCGQLMLEFQQAVQYRSRRQAVAALAEVRRRFPSTEHRCHNLALEKAYEHEL